MQANLHFRSNKNRTAKYETPCLQLHIKLVKTCRFMENVKAWFPENLPCILCINYIHQMDFI